jgi:hypothetical protein
MVFCAQVEPANRLKATLKNSFEKEEGMGMWAKEIIGNAAKKALKSKQFSCNAVLIQQVSF